MSDTLHRKIIELFETEMNLSVPDATTDLIEEGLLDSLIFVDLIVHLETMFDVEIPVADLEFDQFRTVAGIAEFVESLDAGAVSAKQDTAA